MNKKLLRKKLALMLATLKKKRKYYCELEYLKSTGTQYIDLNFIPNNNSGFDITGDFVQTSAAVRFGQRTAAYDRQFMLLTSGDNHMRLDYGTGSAQVSQWSPTNTGGYNRVTLDGTTKIARVYFNNGTIEEYTFTAGNFTAENSCYLFAFNNNGTALIANNMPVKTFKLYDNGTLIRDMIPVLDWDMTPCMYDKVSGELFYNAGTGSFIAGRQIHQVEYLESTGTQYIDTGVIGSDKTRMEIICQGSQTNKAVAGCGETDDRLQIFVGGTYYSVRIDGAATTSTTPSLNKAQIMLDAVSQKATIDGIVYSLPYTGSIASRNIHLFRVNRTTLPPSDTTTNFIGKIWLFKLYDNDTLVRDYIPAIDENGVGYFFDKVTHTIFDNAGTGSFNYPLVELEYLESTGTQYINTLTTLSSTDRVKTKCRIISTEAKARYVFGVFGDNKNFGFNLGSSNTMNGIFGANSVGTSKGNSGVDYEIDLSSNGFFVNGVKKDDVSGTFTGTKNAYLFWNNGTSQLNQANRIYYLQIYHSDTLVRDFIPVYYNGQAGMWDKVNSVFYPNAGTGTFVIGAVKEEEYE